MIRTSDRQGLLRGDLNLLQRAALQWLMNQEIADIVQLERIRFENFALASNKATQNEYVKELFKDYQSTEEEEISGIEWVTPTTAEEADDIARYFTGLGGAV